MAKAWRSVVCYYSALQSLVFTSLVNDDVTTMSENLSTADADTTASPARLAAIAVRGGGHHASTITPVMIPAMDHELVRGLSRGYSQSSSDTSPAVDSSVSAADLPPSNAWDLMRKAEAMAVESLELLHETGDDLSIPRLTLGSMRR